ncbi:glycoside hydrolase family 75 protein [Prosthecobacter sp.]|uniref:glycoside hydrolase family 75 protein n=1 Tax=Prosthecobacter sp. TaxID=1965333 RepID=UPI00248886DE|nr:glycoside hydrolase family 75 protein [Prosthecobacter sp.]MDI1313194.1 glycoside hydrolase family 75 protein [Prosthecobacter sp.]
MPDTTSPSPYESPRRKRGCFGSLLRLLFLLTLIIALVLPFTPFAGKIKQGIQDIVTSARSTKERIVTREVMRDVIKEIPVIKEVTKEIEVIREVRPPLPDKYIPRKDIDVATLFNGITVKTNLITEQGSFASLERLDPEAYKAEFQLSIRVPKANQTLEELSRINKNLPAILPGLDVMLPAAKVSGFYHKLYENKTNRVQNDLTRLSKILDRHNFYDTETILELTHPATQRRALLIQSEMDVVADGSDGDRMPTLEEYIYLSDYYQPFTSYAWAKTTKTPNPLLSKWEDRLQKAQDEYAKKGLSSSRNRDLKVMIDQLKLEVADFKVRSSLIADKDPFIVLSLLFLGYGDQNKFTPQMGDYAAVIHEGKIYPAICGDYGPSFKMGEASLLMAKTINPKATPYIRPESDLKVTYLVFPGTAEKVRSAPDLAKWREKCLALLGEVGGVGAGFELHTWEDPFKKPELPPVTVQPPAAGDAATPGTPGTITTPPASPSAATPPLPAPATAPIILTPIEPPAAATKSGGVKTKNK